MTHQKFISASPTKKFFVRMLTRDIDLVDSILDLLDNCIDGVKRDLNAKKKSDSSYTGYWAKIEANPKHFIITDNCGGISEKILSESAFRMGAPTDKEPEMLGTIGTYGIGMKRAIFKLGQDCRLVTKHNSDEFEVDISQEWMDDENDWELNLIKHSSNKYVLKERGTRLEVSQLHSNIARQFDTNKSNFLEDLQARIGELFALIIEKGFDVYLNGKKIDARKITLLHSTHDAFKHKGVIEPFLYKDTIDGVDVELSVGFYQKLQKAELDEERSSGNAGWTVVCNERVILFADKTELTGWGAGAPKYHTQFISIAGIVNFTSKDAELLPVSTTKRNLEIHSKLYLKVRAKMIEGMLIFMEFTNRWKNNIPEANNYFNRLDKITPAKISQNKDIKWTTSKNDKAKIYRPKLPAPKKVESDKVITFRKSENKIRHVASYLFGDEADDKTASQVGERCFDEILDRSKRG